MLPQIAAPNPDVIRRNDHFGIEIDPGFQPSGLRIADLEVKVDAVEVASRAMIADYPRR